MNREIICVVFALCASMFACGHASESRAVNRVLRSAEKRIEKIYPLHPMGFKIQSPNKIRLLGLQLQAERPFDIDTGRKMVLTCAEILLEEINNSEAIRQYLYKYPFSINDIKINIFRPTPQPGKEAFAPYLTVAGLSQGTLDYCASAPELKYGYKWTVEETYQEALEKAND